MMDMTKRFKKTAMKKNTIKIFSLFTLLSIASCEKADELPPINEGYTTEYILPEATPLTDDDRVLIEEQENEYYLNTK